MYLGGRGHGLSLVARGQVARSDDGGVGIRFDEIASHAFEYLSQLVLFSARNRDEIESELDERLGSPAPARAPRSWTSPHPARL